MTLLLNSLEHTSIKVSVFDAQGRLLKIAPFTIKGHQLNVSLSGYPAGIYYLKISPLDRTFKIIKR
ncbi:MAG: T9SS type A sorting domain-containing protein [Croceivirga sp.]